MPTYRKASELIDKNQVAIVVFSHGEHFTHDALGNGSTGKWHADPERAEEVDKVIIYLRREGENMNRIYVGNYAGTQLADRPHRQVIRFSGLKEDGMSQAN